MAHVRRGFGRGRQCLNPPIFTRSLSPVTSTTHASNSSATATGAPNVTAIPIATANPFTEHDNCWMTSFFDAPESGGVDPMPEGLADAEYTPGMSGPITTHFNGEFIEWEFISV